VELAYAIVRRDPPDVFAAEDVDVLHRVIALHVVAQTPAAAVDDTARADLRAALLDERWGDAVTEWISLTGVPIDVYPSGLTVWTSAASDADIIGLELQFAPLFVD
jgi:hypothetical protein